MLATVALQSAQALDPITYSQLRWAVAAVHVRRCRQEVAPIGHTRLIYVPGIQQENGDPPTDCLRLPLLPAQPSPLFLHQGVGVQPRHPTSIYTHPPPPSTYALVTPPLCLVSQKFLLTAVQYIIPPASLVRPLDCSLSAGWLEISTSTHQPDSTLLSSPKQHVPN